MPTLEPNADPDQVQKVVFNEVPFEQDFELDIPSHGGPLTPHQEHLQAKKIMIHPSMILDNGHISRRVWQRAMQYAAESVQATASQHTGSSGVKFRA